MSRRLTIANVLTALYEPLSVIAPVIVPPPEPACGSCM